METFRETQNRNGTMSISSEEGPSKKRRRSEPETIAYLREKNQSSVELQKEQFALQKPELDMRMEQNNRLNQLLVKSTNNVLKQQQQLSLALLQFLNKQTPP